METILIKPLHHRGKEVMGLVFKPNLALNNVVKKIEDVRWSKTNDCWYLPCSRYYYNQLCTAIDKIAKTDTHLLKAYLDQKQGLVEDVNMPIHKSTVALIQEYPLSEQNLQALITYRNLLTVKKYSKMTIKNYCNIFHQLLRLLGEHFIGDFDKNRVQSYMLWLVEARNCSAPTLNTTVNALKFYFEQVLGRSREFYELPRPRMPKLLPDVLDEQEVVTLFANITNLKHKVLLMTSYSMGLRAGELVKLKLADIDSKRMMVHVRLGKGNKDRFVPLSTKVLDILREYCKVYHPKEYLFEGQSGPSYSTRSAQAVIMSSKVRAKITKPGSIHSLRHTYATHLLENGTDIRYIQELLGHNDIKTTLRYTHIARKAISKIHSPIDFLKM